MGLTGELGEKGERGKRGPKGPPGPKGKDVSAHFVTYATSIPQCSFLRMYLMQVNYYINMWFHINPQYKRSTFRKGNTGFIQLVLNYLLRGNKHAWCCFKLKTNLTQSLIYICCYLHKCNCYGILLLSSMWLGVTNCWVHCLMTNVTVQVLSFIPYKEVSYSLLYNHFLQSCSFP